MTNKYVQTWLPGDNTVICDVCGRKRKRTDCTLAYGNGILPVVMSCTDGCADYNHPLNYPPPVVFDGRPVRDSRPEATDQFVSILSGQTWGKLQLGNWGSLNGSNNAFQFTPIISWGNFYDI